jgi:hypothetical protein
MVYQWGMTPMVAAISSTAMAKGKKFPPTPVEPPGRHDYRIQPAENPESGISISALPKCIVNGNIDAAKSI